MYGVRVHLQQLESLRGLIVSFKARYSLNSISCAWQPHEMSLIDAENLTPANFAFFCMRTPATFFMIARIIAIYTHDFRNDWTH